MNKRILRIVIPVVGIAMLLVGAVVHFGSGAGVGTVKASSGAIADMPAIQKRLLDGLVTSESAGDPPASSNYFPAHGDDQCAQHLGSNIKVNQNCLNLTDPGLQGRAQAQNETAIAQNPKNPNDIVAGYNDYRRGDGTCGVSYSLDGGRIWNDATLPNGFVSGAAFGEVARQYWQASGDPSVAWDTKGNAYYNCMAFMRGDFGLTNNPDESSGIYLFRSTQNNGASWNFPGRPVAQLYNNPGPASGLPLLDKPYMTVDDRVGSPFQDRIYVTYTLFGTDGTAYIFEAHSNDYGESFSSAVLVSASSSLCTVTFGLPTPNGSCNENQFSQPFTGPDGALYVIYDNYNTVALTSTSDNHNQVLLAKSTDGGATFSAPVLVANYNDLPDCATYQAGQDPGRACVPEKGSAQNSVYRAANYASGAVNPTNPSQVVVTFASYINGDSNPSNGCVPTGFAADGNNLYTGVKTAGACNNKILESVSTNGGASFNGTVTDPTTLPIVSSARGQKLTDQWWQWTAITRDGKLAVSYYDRQYGSDETTGTTDVSLSALRNFPLPHFDVIRVTSSSMPLPTEFPDAQGNSLFYGDYTGLSAITQGAHPLWMDTRNKDLFLCSGTGAPGIPPAVCGLTVSSGIVANDQDVFTKTVPLFEFGEDQQP